jgi:hypothetical protein
VVAPSYFYENVLGARAAIREGRLPIALPRDKPLHQVSLANLGAFVTAVLNRREEHISKRVEVAGDAPTPEAMADAIGVRYDETPIAELRHRNEDLAAMYELLADEGYGIDTVALRNCYPEIPWTSFADWTGTVNW